MRMIGKKWVALISLVSIIVMQWSGIVPLSAASAEGAGPRLVISEIVPASAGTGQPYEYVEIYNNSPDTIDLNGYRLQYYTSNMNNPANVWTISNKTIPSGEALVLWLKKFNYPDVPLADFNANYGTELTADRVFEVMLTTSAQGLSDTALRKVAIAGSDGVPISSAMINEGETDGIINRSVIYAIGPTEMMVKLRNNETPTPGVLLPGQLESAPEPKPEPEPGERAPLLITELVPDTSNYASYDAFEYMEIYNAGDDPVLLQGYTFKSSNWSVTIAEPITIGAWETKVIWTRRAEIAPLSKEAFNSYYMKSALSKYIPEQDLIIFENIGGLVNGGGSVVIENPSGATIARATYAAGDVADGKSITYRYPEENGTDMRMIAGLQQPTPGWLIPGQAPAKPVTNAVPPAAPAHVTALAEEGKATLSWSPNPEADIHHYNIYKDGVWEFAVPAHRTGYTAYGLTGGATYGFEVTAVNTSDVESDRSALAQATPEHEKLTQTVRTAWSQPEKYAATWAMAEAGPVIPGLAEGVVPQGMAYDERRDWLLTVSYFDDGRPGALAVVDRATGQLVKSLSLYEEDGSPYLGHAGGISVTGEHVWIGSESYLYRLDMADVEAGAHGGQVQYAERVPVPLNVAFTAYDDGVLWAGEFYEAKAYPTDPSHHMTNRAGETQYAWMAGFRLDEVAEHLRSDSWNGDSSQTAVPDYLFSITGKVQGAALDSGTVYLSTSYGRGNDSVLYRYDNPLREEAHATVSVGGRNVPLWFLDSQSEKESNARLVTVPMAEGIALAGNELYVLLESGANKYRYTTTFIMDSMLKLDTVAWDNGGTEPPAGSGSLVRVSQIMYDASGADDGKEYIVIRNYGDTAEDIGGYMLGDGINEGGGEGMAAFPEGTVIQPGQEIVVGQSGLIFKQTYGVVPDFEFPWIGVFRPEDDPDVPDMLTTTWSTGVVQLANGGDEVLLMDRNKEIVDFVPYSKDITYRGVFYKGVTAKAGGDGNALHRVGLTGDLTVDFEAGPPALPHRPIAVPVSNTLLITEVVYDPLFEEVTGEFIEIANITDQPIDISGYYLGDEETEGQAAAEGMYNFPEGTIIEPHQALVIAKNAKGIEERYGVKADFELDDSDDEVAKMIPNCAWGCGNMQLANTGDEVLLLDADKALVDVVVYKGGKYLGIEAHPGVAGGHSLERVSGIDTKNSRADFVDQPNPTPGVLLFGPNGRPDLIPVPDLKDKVLELGEAATSLAAAPTVIDAAADWPAVLPSDIPSYLLKAEREGGKLMAANRGEELSAALDRIADIRLPIVELNDPSLVGPVHELLDGKGLSDVVIVSAEPSIVAAMRERNDEYRGAVRITEDALDADALKDVVLAVRRSTGLTALLPYRTLTSDTVRYLAARGIAVWGFGAVTEEDAHRVIASGASGLETANAAAAASALRTYSEADTLGMAPLFIAHRGMNALAPENTMPAFELAVEMKADVIETDVMISKDGELVLLHDFTVDRTTDGSGRVSELTLAELKRLTANKTDNAAWKPYYDRYDTARIPALSELLAYAKGKGIVLALEMKGIGYEQKLVDLIVEHDMVTDVYVTSFSSEVLQRIRALHPDIGIGFVLDGGAPAPGSELVQAEKIVTDNVQLGAFFLSSTTLLTPELMAYAKHRGLPVTAWTINTKRGMQDLFKLGAAGIITDYAHWMNEAPIGIALSAPGGYTLETGKSAALEQIAQGVTRSAGAVPVRGVRVIGGDEGVIAVDENNGAITALKAGRAVVQAYIDDQPFHRTADGDSMLLENSWRMYSAPIVITVRSTQQPDNPGTGGGGNNGNNGNNGNSGNGNGNGNGESDGEGSPERYEPTIEELKASQGRLELAAGQTTLALPANMAEWVERNGLSVGSGQLELSLPQQLLQGAVKPLPEEQRKDWKLELTIKPLSGGEQAAWLKAASDRSGARIEAQGPVVELMLELVSAAGERIEVQAFDGEAKLRFRLQPGTDPWLAGIYRLEKDGAPTYIGGKAADDVMEASTPHFSRYALLAYDKSYLDVPQSHWAYPVIGKLSAKHIVEGIGADTFAPDRRVTRAEFTALLVRTLGLKPEASGSEAAGPSPSPFGDVATGKWYAEPIQAAYEAGLINGVAEDRFGPDEAITREQMAVLLVRAHDWIRNAAGETVERSQSQAGSEALPFRDAKAVSGWAAADVKAAAELGLIQGSQGLMAPQKLASRAESVQALYNLIAMLALLP